MKRKFRMYIISLLILIILITGIGFATEALAISVDHSYFTNPPETSGHEWEGTYPYGRNIYWDFETNPTTHPATGYYGTLDNALKSGDSVRFTGDVGWAPIIEKVGVISLCGDASGSAIFHINNLNINYPKKFFWLEMNVCTFADPLCKDSFATVTQSLSAPGSTITSSWSSGTGDGLRNAWFKIEPFSSSEDLTINFASKGFLSYAAISDLHIAASPEPIGAALFVIGAGALGFIKYRRKNRVV